MASLTKEEDNYVRIGLLITGISPRAARVLFDREFHPSFLYATLKKEYKKLNDLKDKKKVINLQQWNLLFPRQPDIPKSDTFDVTLIITLLRNLAELTYPVKGYDHLPGSTETSPASDLARIKYYRNYIAHMEICKIDNTFFSTSWEDISEAIGRLGGPSMRLECDQLKTKVLDQTNKEIILEIKHSKNEIEELKQSFKILKICHEEEQAANAKTKEELLTEIEVLKTVQEEVIPKNIRDQINKQIENWKKKDKMFVSTRASDHVIKCLQDNSCVTLTGPAGVGKSFIARHTTLVLQNEGYTIIPIYSPTDIRVYYQPGKQTVFIVDDICGNFTANQQQIENWEQLLPVINTIIADKCCKVIVCCRLQVFKDDKFIMLSPLIPCECNLISDELCLTENEKTKIADKYNIGLNSMNLNESAKHCEFFPLLCYLFHEKKGTDVKEFFRIPFDIYKKELDNFSRHGDEGKHKVCGLALCVLFNNRLLEEWLQGKVTDEQRQIIEDTCEGCKLNRSTSKAELKMALDSLDGTFMCKENGVYSILHDKLFDFIAYFFGQKMIECLIEHGDSCFVTERFLWMKSQDEKMKNIDFIIDIQDKYLDSYLKRLIKIWSAGIVALVFSSSNMKVLLFRQQLLQHLIRLDKEQQIVLANIKDTVIPKEECGSGTTPLILSCRDGYTEMIQWLLDNEVDVNHYKDDRVTALNMACCKRYSSIVDMLLKKNPNVDLCEKKRM
ncbi:uncharacterized protein [Mytilus edulis]|uniref:uncharacterized protein n=1 Tax=Mytilus edulis TaxID=6550 RepID=UPI0039F142F6